MTKNNEVIAEKSFQNSGVTRRLWRFQHATVLEQGIEEGFSLILSIYKKTAKCQYQCQSYIYIVQSHPVSLLR